MGSCLVALMGARPRGPAHLGVALFVGGAVACGPTKPACAPESELAKLEAEHVATAMLLCKGYTTQTCPALPKLRQEFHDRVEAWRECR